MNPLPFLTVCGDNSPFHPHGSPVVRLAKPLRNMAMALFSITAAIIANDAVTAKYHQLTQTYIILFPRAYICKNIRSFCVFFLLLSSFIIHPSTFARRFMV